MKIEMLGKFVIKKRLYVLIMDSEEDIEWRIIKESHCKQAKKRASKKL